MVFDLRYIIKKKKKSSTECLLDIFETGFLLHFLFKWVALMIWPHRFQNYAKMKIKLALVKFIFLNYIRYYIL